jgi:hypothetical protein
LIPIAVSFQDTMTFSVKSNLFYESNNSKMKKNILFLFVITICRIGFSQPGHENELTIKGKVITVENGVEMPVPNAKVLMERR